MLVELFIEGLCLAIDSFQMTSLEARLGGVEAAVQSLEYETSRLSSELTKVHNIVNRQSTCHIATLRDSALQLLGRVNQATSVNADVLSFFVASVGTLITAVTFKGRRRPRTDFKYGLTTYRGFLAATQSPERIFQTLAKLQDLLDITGGRIVTAAVESTEDMKAVAMAIAAFFKIAALFGVKTCPPLSDSSSEAHNSTDGEDEEAPGDMQITVRFEGRYSMASYEQVVKERTGRLEVLKAHRRNVYILGANGAGKSSWGNLISGEDPFEVGVSNHTTMIPQPCDMRRAYNFRLWDTPGLFDGSEEQGLMEDYMNHVIDVNGYCSGVLFVFSGVVPANEVTARILQYAVKRLGPHVRRNFVAIINDMYGAHGRYKATYSEMLHAHGFEEDGVNVLVSSALATPNRHCPGIRQRLAGFNERLVASHVRAYRAVIDGQGHGDLRQAVRKLYWHGRQELDSVLRRGRIETVRYCASGPRKNTAVAKDVLFFRQHSKNVLVRILGLGHDHIVEERSVQLKGSPYFVTLIRAQMNQEYTFGEVNIFVKHILGNERYMLIHTPKAQYDYELRDATLMSDAELQELVVSHLMDEMK